MQPFVDTARLEEISGVRAIARLQSEGIRTHATLCCSAAQALVVAKCDTRVMVASLRHVAEVQEVAALGADACTVGLELLQRLIQHPMSATLYASYVAAWNRS